MFKLVKDCKDKYDSYNLGYMRGWEARKKEEEKMWQCKKCGKCCKFIVIPVAEPVDMETMAYLDAHGIAVDMGKVIIPAICKYLTADNLCSIHDNKFANCRLGGEKECKEAKKQYEKIEEAR